MGAAKSIKKGDLVVMVSATFFDEWKGAIATVVEGYSMRLDVMNIQTLRRENFMGYKLRLGDGRLVSAEPYQVRPLPPLGDEESLDLMVAAFIEQLKRIDSGSNLICSN